MRKQVLTVIAALMLAGCTAVSETPEPANAPAGNQGCDAFETCEDASADQSETVMTFKEDYESLNGAANSSGKLHRTITISETHPFVYAQPSDILNMIQNKESFWLYVGDSKCPWCRAVIESAIAAAAEQGVTAIQYLPIWDSEGNEILRDKYELVSGKPVKVSDGAPEYAELLSVLDPLLGPYELEGEDGQMVDVGEKRIYAPTYVRIEEGKPVRLTTGIPTELSDPRGELSASQLEEEKNQFMEFFAE